MVVVTVTMYGRRADVIDLSVQDSADISLCPSHEHQKSMRANSKSDPPAVHAPLQWQLVGLSDRANPISA